MHQVVGGSKNDTWETVRPGWNWRAGTGYCTNFRQPNNPGGHRVKRTRRQGEIFTKEGGKEKKKGDRGKKSKQKKEGKNAQDTKTRLFNTRRLLVGSEQKEYRLERLERVKGNEQARLPREKKNATSPISNFTQKTPRKEEVLSGNTTSHN